MEIGERATKGAPSAGRIIKRRLSDRARTLLMNSLSGEQLLDAEPVEIAEPAPDDGRKDDSKAAAAAAKARPPSPPRDDLSPDAAPKVMGQPAEEHPPPPAPEITLSTSPAAPVAGVPSPAASPTAAAQNTYQYAGCRKVQGR